MRPRRSSRFRSVLLLSALCGVLGAIVYEEVERPLGSEIVVAAGAPVSMPALPPEPQFTMPPESSFAAVLERPVFSPTRRPLQASDAKAAPAPSVDFTLIGIVITGAERHALVKSSNGDALERLSEGDELAGWSAVSIGSDRVLFRRGTVQKEVVLDYKAPAPPGGPRTKHKLANASAQPGQPPPPPVDGQQPQPAPESAPAEPPAAPGQ
jgi:hypothetical protein